MVEKIKKRKRKKSGKMLQSLCLGTKKYIKAVDKLLILCSVVLSVCGLIAISSATKAGGVWNRNMVVQLAAIGVGLLMMVILSKIDYEAISELTPIIILFSAALLLFTAFFAKEIKGNKNWLDLGFISVQPSEMTKVCFAITMATHLKKLGPEMNKVKNILLLILHFACYFVPIVLQKDIGSALIYVGMFAILLFVSGIYYRYILIFGAAGIAAVPLVWQHFSEYQKARIIYGLQPELDPLNYGLQPMVSRMAIGSGQMFGLGYGNGIQTQNDLLPESNTDFIFSIIGEEFGFVGCMIVIVLILAIALLIIKNAYKAKNELGSYICIAIAGMILLQSCINIGMCLGISPVIGVTLPFVSYGGSSVLSLFLCLGIVQGVRIKPEKELRFTVGGE